jgi:hypothetical protein
MASDVGMLKREARKNHERVKYPYEHKDRMPGIYWMFQESYAINSPKIISTDKKVQDEQIKIQEQIYRYKSRRTANKFVRLTSDRNKGGDSRGDFNLEDLDDWTVREDYEFPYVSKGLSCILAITDWWVRTTEKDPNTSKLALAEKLAENKFGGLEIGDLVYLIGGSRVTLEEATLFDEYLRLTGSRKPRPILSEDVLRDLRLREARLLR